MHKLYLRVLKRSENQFEQMPASFFFNVCSTVDSVFAVICRKDDKIVAFSLNAEDNNLVYGIYLGYDDTYNPQQIYFNLLYKIIEEAMERGKNSIQFGQTSYDIKSALGVTVAQTYLGIHASNSLVLRLIKKWSTAIFPPTELPKRRVFRNVPGTNYKERSDRLT